MKLLLCLAFTAGIAVNSGFVALTSKPVPSEDVSVETMLEAFVTDYRKDAMARGPLTFGVLVKDAEDPEWHVVIKEREQDAEQADVRLEIGFPDEPIPYFVTDVETITKIYRGEMASLTAMGKAFSTDFAPLDYEFMEGFEPTDETAAQMMVLSFHFWMRGFPEIIPFGRKELTREAHGGNAVLFYYQPGFRSGWFLIEPGQHVNENPDSRRNPFPTLLICTKGEVRAKLDETEYDLKQGEAMFIGPDVSHEFWVTGDEAAEGVLLMFGDGA